MSSQAAISAALLAAFNLDADNGDPSVVADAAASVLVAFANLMRAPAPVPYFSGGELKFATAVRVADETLVLTLAEQRKQTTLLEVLAKQGDRLANCTAPATGAAASGLPG